MTEPDELVGVGSPIQLSAKAQAFTCRACKGPVWIVPSTLNHMRAVAKGKPLHFLCLGCVKTEPDGKIQPLDAAQIAEVQAAGIDLTPEQLNAETARLFDWLRRR